VEHRELARRPPLTAASPGLGIECCKAVLLLYGYTVAMEKETSFVTVQARGVIAIPPALRRQFGLDRPGAQVEVVERDGEIVLRPHVPVPSDQAWFWSERWQKMERQADDDVAADKIASFENVDDFLADLDS
jgi:antitoxin MazE